ncbi:zinc finger BED domain-containing protein RICESLEEPER 2 [Tanacetum coccineum]
MQPRSLCFKPNINKEGKGVILYVLMSMSNISKQICERDFSQGTMNLMMYWGFGKQRKISFCSIRMAENILSVQASSVASESAFSTSGRILSIRRTRLTAESLEMCMCLKDHLDAHERRQHTTPLELHWS